MGAWRGMICGGNVPARMRDGKRRLAGPVPRTIKAVSGKYNLQMKVEAQRP